ncbi:MAG: hypothetical protein ACLP59_23110 [Bryobacteraceae bacterium]
MIAVKEAVGNAVEFARNMLAPPPQDLRLEEVESGKYDRVDAWRITLSMQDRAGLGSLGRREYKVFTVRRDTGEVISMRIRELASA